MILPLASNRLVVILSQRNGVSLSCHKINKSVVVSFTIRHFLLFAFFCYLPVTSLLSFPLHCMVFVVGGYDSGTGYFIISISFPV